MRSLNLGILAHVDAGKTTLTERLLYDAGVIDEVGSVDDGSTQTDTLALERQRGITIKSAVVSFTIGDLVVNLIDTPGHSDFIAEVERVLGVLDGVVLVISAVEGVQAQTRVLMRALHRLAIPTVMFVNKTDRTGARRDDLLEEIAERLCSQGCEHPVFFGSAATGAGVEALTHGIATLLPATEGDAAGPPSGTVFKVERGPAGEKVALVRMFRGTVRVRDRLRLPSGRTEKVTGMTVYDGGGSVRADAVTAGRIARIRGLDTVRIGDPVGDPIGTPVEPSFSRPTLETVVDAVRQKDRGALHVALTQLAEQDPLIDLRQDAGSQETWVSLYGEVQKQVIAATLLDEYGVEATFRESRTICLERVVGTGEAFEVIAVPPNSFLATVGLRVEPAEPGAGVSFGLEVERGSMPPAFFRAVEETVHAHLAHGGLHGWEVTDCVVTMTRSGYWARQSHAHGTFDASMSSTAGDFRNLTPLVLGAALRRAGTRVLEPIHRFDLQVPADTLGAVLSALAGLRAVPLETAQRGSTYLLAGDVPAAQVHRLQQELPGLTRGEGELTTEFDHHSPVRGPARQRTRG